MANSQKKIAMLAGNFDGVNSRSKYISFSRFIGRHSSQIDVLIVAVWLLVALRIIAGGAL